MVYYGKLVSTKGC